MAIKGGYKIIDFKDVNITIGSDAVTIKGIYESLESNYRKPTLCTNLVINENEKCARYVVFGVNGTSFVGKTIIDDVVSTITITDSDQVTITQ